MGDLRGDGGFSITGDLTGLETGVVIGVVVGVICSVVVCSAGRIGKASVSTFALNFCGKSLGT